MPVVTVIVPVYQEASTVEEALDRVLAVDIPGVAIELLIVESNSTDGTRQVVQRIGRREGVTVVLQDAPRGKGNAVREAFHHANGEVILLQDADLEYDTGDYARLLEPILDGSAEFVLGTRHADGRPMRQMDGERIASLVTNFGHAFFLRVFNLAFGVSLTDPFTMYKVFRTDCIRGVKFECDRFDFDWELTGKLIRLGYVPMEIPVAYKSRGFKEGKKVRFIRDPLTWVVAAIRFSTCRLETFAGSRTASDIAGGAA